MGRVTSVRPRSRGREFRTRVIADFPSRSYRRSTAMRGALKETGNEMAAISAVRVGSFDPSISLNIRGWRTVTTPHAYVDQQGVTTYRALVRQRTRWYQGTMQCAGRIPATCGPHRALLSCARTYSATHRALWRILRRRTGWAKTARVAETPSEGRQVMRPAALTVE